MILYPPPADQSRYGLFLQHYGEARSLGVANVLGIQSAAYYTLLRSFFGEEMPSESATHRSR